MKNVNKKLLIVTVVALVLAVSCVVGTFAFLARKTDTITNTFVSGDITIALTETTGESYTMVPGETIEKDPKVTVSANSEDCYVFVKIEESTNFDTTNVFTYSVDSAWTAVEGETGVYYYVFNAGEIENGRVKADKVLNVIQDNSITVKNTATADDMEDATNSTLTITAYAVQKGAGDVAAAWAVAEGLDA